MRDEPPAVKPVIPLPAIEEYAKKYPNVSPAELRAVLETEIVLSGADEPGELVNPRLLALMPRNLDPKNVPYSSANRFYSTKGNWSDMGLAVLEFWSSHAEVKKLLERGHCESYWCIRDKVPEDLRKRTDTTLQLMEKYDGD